MYGLLVIVVIALVLGWWKSEEFEIALEINMFTGPSFKIGVTSERYYTQEDVQDEVIIGLFIVNVIFTFHKPLEEI